MSSESDPVLMPPVPVRQTPSRSQWITFGVLLTVSILLFLATFAFLWEALLLAAVLAGAFSSAHDRLAVRLKNRRYISSGIFTVGVVVLIVAPIATILIVAINESIAAVDFVRNTLDQGGSRELVNQLPESIQGAVRYALEFLSKRASGLSSELRAGGALAVSLVSDALSKTGTILVDTTLMLIALNYFLADGHRLIAWIQEASPLKNRQTAELLREFHRTSRSALGSMTATAAIQAIVATIGYVIAGIPQPFFFGLLTFIAAFIPSIGTALVAVPLSGLLILLGDTGWGIFLLVYSVVIVGLVDNLVKPLLMRDGMKIHGAIIFFALVGGLIVFGPTGLIVGPLAVTFFLSMLRLGQRDFSSDP